VTAKLTAKVVNNLETTGTRYRVWDTEIKGFHVRVSPQGKKTYALFYRHDGQQKDYLLGIHGSVTSEQARELAKQRIGEVAGGKDIQAAKRQDKARAERARYETLKAFIEHKYKPWAESHLKTSDEALRTLERDFAHLNARRLEDISKWDIQKWAAQKMKDGMHAATINRRVGTLKAVLSRAKEWGVIADNPLSGAKRIKTDDKARVRFLSDDEEKALRAALEARQQEQRAERLRYIEWRNERKLPPPKPFNAKYTDHLQPMTLLAINTGLRRGELFNLKRTDIDLKGRTLTVEGTTAKSGSTRHIPLNDEAFAVLVAWLNQRGEREKSKEEDQSKKDDLVFPSPATGDRLTHIKSSWASLIMKAGITQFRFHDLRHHFASKLVMKGVDLNTVRELLGHHSIDMTLRYAHLSPDHKAAAVALLHS